MVELRKRKAAAEPAPAPPPKKNSNPIKKAIDKAKEAIIDAPAQATTGAGKLAVGDTISVNGFGGDVETHAGEKTTLKKLLDDSKAGVVLFTYPKASTPGCTTQACLFRDNYSALTESGLSVYGLSTDSPKSNTTFATKQSLPYPLLCDPSAKLIAAIGLKKSPKGTSRGVIVIDKTGKVTAWEQGGPQRTVDVVMAVLPKGGQTSTSAEVAPESMVENGIASADPGQASMNGQADGTSTTEALNAEQSPEQLPQQGTAEQVKTANTAAEVADSAEKIDEHVQLGPSA